MKISIKKLENVLFKLLYISVFGIMFMQTLDVSFLVSLFFSLSLLITILLGGISLMNKVTKEDYLVVGIIIVAFISVFLNFVLSAGVFSFSYFKKVILFSIVLFFLQYVNKSRISALKKKFVIQMVDLTSLLFIVMFFLQGKNKYLINGIVSRYLTFQFSNPNLVAMILLCLFMYQSITLLHTKDQKILKIRITMTLLLAYFIYLTKARNTQLVMIMYVLAYIWVYVTKKTNLNINIKLSSFLSVFPLLFFGAYMLIINNPLIQNIFGFMQTLGKGLDSRLKIWEPAWNHFLKSPLLGAYYQISEGTGASHLHNSHLDVLASFGILVFIGVCVYICTLIYQKNKNYKTKESFLYMIAFIATLLLGMGETALFSGALSTYVFMGTFLMLSHGERKVDHEINSVDQK